MPPLQDADLATTHSSHTHDHRSHQQHLASTPRANGSSHRHRPSNPTLPPRSAYSTDYRTSQPPTTLIHHLHPQPAQPTSIVLPPTAPTTTNLISETLELLSIITFLSGLCSFAVINPSRRWEFSDQRLIVLVTVVVAATVVLPRFLLLAGLGLVLKGFREAKRDGGKRITAENIFKKTRKRTR
ncbi:hypothetical protein MMC21_001322 [Puttea exsequens]|nr:hypothetical protein [Puttea exsequens]